MRTAIYVYAPTLLTIVGAEPVRLSPLDRSAPDVILRAGHHEIPVAAGVYRVKTGTAITVTGDHVESVTMRDQDHYPYPPQHLLDAFPAITRGELAGFFRRPVPYTRRSSHGPWLDDPREGGKPATLQGHDRRKHRALTAITPPKQVAASTSREKPMSFRVTSHPTVQITIYDAMRTIRGRAEGSLQLSLPSGLYRVHFERGGVVHKEIVDHEAATDLEHAGPPLRSPVPFAGAATSHDYYIRPAQRVSVEDTGPPLGTASHTSRLFVFLRRAERDGYPRSLPSEPVTIHDVAGRPLTTISQDNAEVDDDNGYVAFACSVTPGTYRIRGARSQRDVAITIPAGRAAHMFVADAGIVRLEELRVSLVPVGTRFDPASPIWSAMESMIAALRTPGRAFPAAARALLPGAADDDLCFGIAAASLLWRCDDRPAVSTLLKRLANYRDIPDLAILARLDQLTRLGPLEATPESPPLLRTSLVMAMTRSELDSRDVPTDCALAQAARRQLHDSIWCSWSTRTWDERWIEPTVERLRSQDRRRDAASIARSLALPRQTVEHTLRALDATMPSANEHPIDQVEDMIPGYILDQVIGRGAQSTVFRSTRRADSHAVALKVVPLDGGATECARVHHLLDRIESVDDPGILVPTARGTLPGDTGIWLEMELCRGSAIDLLSEAEAPLPVPDAVRMVIEALQGLAHLHDRSIVHGGIRPGNLLVRDDNGVAIADLRLTTCWADVTRSGSAVGSLRFVPPELLVGNEQPRPGSDVWSMAAILYLLLTLEPPRDEYAGQSQLEAARHNPIVPVALCRPDVPPDLARCVDRALSLEVRSRPIDATAFRDELTSLHGAGNIHS